MKRQTKPDLDSTRRNGPNLFAGQPALFRKRHPNGNGDLTHNGNGHATELNPGKPKIYFLKVRM